MSLELNRMEKRCVDRYNNLAKNFNTISHQQTRMLKNENINAAKELTSHAYAKANSYTNLIIVAGYIGFFTLWSSLKNDLPSWAILSSGFCILLSLLIFIGFELYKMISGSIKMHKLSKRLQNPTIETLNEIQRIERDGALSSAKIWIFTVIPTVFFGVAAGLILLFCFTVTFLEPYLK